MSQDWRFLHPSRFAPLYITLYHSQQEFFFTTSLPAFTASMHWDWLDSLHKLGYPALFCFHVCYSPRRDATFFFFFSLQG